MLSNTTLAEIFNQTIENIQEKAELARYERVRKIVFADAPFTVETGELTPSLKVKRRVVLDKYKEKIDAMYTDKPKQESPVISG